MSIKYNGEIVAGKYKTQVIPQADTLNSGIIKIATDTEIEQGTDNTTAVTPLHLSLKQDKLIAGDNIFIDENLIECEIYPDDTTIVKNDNNTLTSVATKTKSGTIKINWEGTNEQYEAGLANGSISSDWYCYITDDEQTIYYEDYVTNDTLEASNIFKLGENKLSDPKGYSQLKLEYDRGSSKIDILVKDDYKIIGSPEISGDGILSNTSNTDYIYKNNINFNGNDYEITLNFTLSDITPQNDYTLLFLNCGNIYDDTNAFFRSWVSNTGQIRITYTDGVNDLVSTEAYNLDLNKTYTIKIGYDHQNDQMYQKIFDNNGMMLTFQYINLEDYIENFMTGNLTLVIGYGINGGLENTTIDLNSLKIKSDNKVLYTPLLKIPYILSKQGSKIVNIEHQYRVLNWYEINGESKYYVIDTINKTFYMPLVSNVLSNVVYNLLDNDLSNITQSGLDIIRQNGGSSLPLGTPVVLDRILSYEESQGLALQGTYAYKTAVAGERYGYPDFYNTYVDYKNNATATQTTLGSSTITIYNNANGLKFYDIADKGVIDTFFNSTGVADFYGVDETNERIFLPRNNKFWQFTTDTNEVNNYVEAGLPTHTHTRGTMNITGGFKLIQMISSDTASGAFQVTKTDTNYGSRTSGSQKDDNFTFDASRSWTGATSAPNNAIYGKSDTVQPPSSKKLLYYVVGNTVSDTSWIDVVTQVNGGVKDLEDKTQEGIERLNAIDALTTTQITNCITEIPQDIKLELNDGVPTLKAGSKVYVPNGFEADGTTPKFDEVMIESDVTLTLAWGTTNATMLLFYGNGRLNRMEIQRCVSGATNPYTSAYAHFWYDTSSNIIHNFAKDGSLLETDFSLPLCIYTAFGKDANGNDTPKAVSIDQTFNGFGYIGSTVFVTKGVKGLIPNGRNEDGTLNNIEFVTDKVMTTTNPANTKKDLAITIQTNGIDRINTSMYKYNSEENLNYDGERATYFSGIICAYYTRNLGVVDSFNPKLPFRAVDYSDYANGVGSTKAYITETYKNGTSWYRIYSDGWCEQGGKFNIGSDKNVTTTFLKPFKDTDYTLTTSQYYSGTTVSGTANAPANWVQSRSNTSFKVYEDIKSCDVYWYACGYIN